MIKKVMKVHTESVWERYKFSLLMAFSLGTIVGLTISLILIRWGMSIA